MGRRRDELAVQGMIDGGELPLAEVRHNEEYLRRVNDALEAGLKREVAQDLIAQEMAIERLVEAFGGEVTRVVDCGLDEGSALHNAQVENLY